MAADRAEQPERYAEFRDFYEQYYPRLARYCFRLVRDEESARDLAQESFARLLTRWIGLRDPAAYLFHVATNLARASWQRRERERAAIEATPPQPAEDRYRRVHLAVNRLSRRHREIVLLYYFADLPVAAVAAAVRRPEGTVKRQLAEARALLAPELENPDASLLD